MKKILISSTNKDVIEVVKTICNKYTEYFNYMVCPDTDEALSFIDYELPEIKVIDFTCEDLDSERILSSIDMDPWLHNGGIIAVVKNQAEVQKIEERKDPNILIVQTVDNFKQNFQHLLKILWYNQKFLFNRGMQERMGGQEAGGFVSDNDPIDLRLFTNFLVNYLYFTNRINEEGRFSLQTSLMELLTNALEHGNCNISYQEKTEWLESGKNILDLIKQKNSDPQIAAKKIKITYLIAKDKTTFKITDEGEGFDWKSCLDVDYTEDTHGRGIMLSKTMVSNLYYNEKGNEVSIEIENQLDATNSVPGIMIPFKTISYEPRQIVCRQDEPSNDLFFIVSGRYGVYSNGKLISVLTPNDMFIGEMAFLLNDRRSATILSAGEGKLIKIPKVSFLNLIRKNPHYGIFLSKLLAQRVVKQNQKTIELQEELNNLKKELNKN